MNAQLSKWGNSTAIRIPKSILQTAKFSGYEELEIKASAGVIEIRKSTPKVDLAALFKDYKKGKPEVYDWGLEKGREEW